MDEANDSTRFYPTLLPREDLKIELVLSDCDLQQQVEENLRPLVLSADVIQRIRNVFEREMDFGLAKSPQRQSSLHMENTFVPEPTNGTEEGEYVALDLGGTNFRVIWIHMEDGTITSSLAKNFTVPLQVQQGPGAELFDYLAECIHSALEEFGLSGKHLPLGFTFSFPMIQTALDVGILVRWTKSYKCTGVIGQDAVKMLNDALRRKKGVRVNVVAVLNDTTGVLVQGAYLDRRTAIGVGIGTGFNACYLEKVDRVEKWEQHPDVKEVAIDTECGAFGDNGVVDFLKTDIDREVDESSPLVKNYTFEKYISGKYLGEVVRCMFLKLIRNNLLFPGFPVTVFNTYESFSTKHVSLVESDRDSSDNTKLVIEELGLAKFATEDDVAIFRYVCAIVSTRAAQLISACLSCLVERVDRSELTIAIDGSVYKLHPKLHSLITYYISEMVPSKKFQLMLAEDGSGIGAGLIAAIAQRLGKKE